MHTPEKFKETDTAVLHSLVKSHPLGTWVTSINDDLDVNHIPFLLDCDDGEYGTLRGHVSRANPVWKKLSNEKQSIVVFQGAERYITPSWYASKREHGKVVPTWNYVVVHAHGIPRAISDQNWLLDHLNKLTDGQESKQVEPWKVSDAPDDFIDRMLRGIVGIEIPIDKLVGAWKTSQNKQQADKEGVIAGLSRESDSQSQQMSVYVSGHALKA